MMARWWLYVSGLGVLLLITKTCCQARSEEEVTQSPPVTPSSRPTGDDILLSLCPPKGSTALQFPKVKKNLLIVSTLDGQLTALDLANSGEMLWSTPTHPGPMLSSTISSMELDDRGQWMKLIPSLTGKLYKFNGEHVEPMNVDANSFVSYSLKMQKNLIFTGGKETRTMGIDLKTGDLQYECPMDGECKKFADDAEEILKDILVVQRNTQTVRAHEPRTGLEKWNFSVSLHDVDYHPGQDLCEDVGVEENGNIEVDEEEDFNLKTVVPDGVICAVENGNTDRIRWRRKFQSPIVDAWRVINGKITQMDLFSRNSVPRRDSLLDDDDDPDDVPPQLYIGRHENQLYIQESILMQQQTEQGLREYNLNPTGSESMFPKVSWKPYLVSPSRTPYYNHESNPYEGLPLLTFDQKLTEADAKSTALAITRDDAQYPFDSGYFLYPDRVQLINNSEIVEPQEDEDSDYPPVSVQFIYMNLWHWWKEVVFISVVTAILTNFLIYRPMAEMNYQERSRELIRYFQANNVEVKEKIVVVEVPVQVHNLHTNTTGSTPLTPSTNSDGNSFPDFISTSRQNSDFTSRYFSDFEPKTCLGRGGFGVVFESKNKYDDIHYAVKRITLPRGEERRKKVKREVRVLAKLEHRNIVRYFSTWEETPPIGWQEEQDIWFADADIGSGPSLMQTEDPTSADFNVNLKSGGAIRKQKNPLLPFNNNTSFSSVPDREVESNSFSVVFENSSSKNKSDSRSCDKSDNCESSDGIVFEEASGREQKCFNTEAVRLRIDSTEEEEEEESDNEMFLRSESLSCEEAIKWDKDQNGLQTETGQITSPDDRAPREKAFLYIVMQLCHRETLRDWLSSNTNRSRSEILDIFRQICVGVEYVHSMGLVHRDLKPSNIYFSTDAERVIKIGDFGLVTHSDLGAADDGDHNHSLPRDGTGQLTDQVGTQMYMSPEQLGQRPYNHKVDIYSLGLIFLELLVPTSTGMERVQVLSEAKRTQFPGSLSGCEEQILLKRMLHHKPESRPEASDILELSWMQETKKRLRLNTSSSGGGDLDPSLSQCLDEDILCEEILDN